MRRPVSIYGIETISNRTDPLISTVLWQGQSCSDRGCRPFRFSLLPALLANQPLQHSHLLPLWKRDDVTDLERRWL